MATTIECGAAEVNLKIPEGTDWSIDLEFRDSNGDLLDLTGETFRAHVRANADAITAVNELDCNVTGTGILTLSLTQSDNLNRPGVSCVWSLMRDSLNEMVMYGACDWCQNPTLPPPAN